MAVKTRPLYIFPSSMSSDLRTNNVLSVRVTQQETRAFQLLNVSKYSLELVYLPQNVQMQKAALRPFW